MAQKRKAPVKRKTNNKNTRFSLSRFSTSNMLIFALLFAAVAGFLIWKSFAATNASLTAANFKSTLSTGASTEPGTGKKKTTTVVKLLGASGNKAYLQNTNIHLDPGIYKVCLFAWVQSGTASGTISVSGATIVNPGYSQSYTPDYTGTIACVSNVQVISTTASLQATVTNTGGTIRFGSVIFTKTGSIQPQPSCSRTISTGTSISSTISSMSSGQILCLNSGTYSEDVSLSRSITLRNAPNATPTIRKITISAGNSAVIGLNITGGSDPLVRVNNGISQVAIKSNKIHDGQGNGMRTFANYVTIENNEMYHFQDEDAIRIWGDHDVIRGNYIHDVQNSGHNDPFQTWLLDGNEPGPPVTNLLMENNVVKNFPGSNGHCFMAESTTSRHHDWMIRKNTFDTIGSHCFLLGGDVSGDQGIANVTFDGNTFRNIGGTVITCSNQTTGVIYANNDFGGYSSDKILYNPSHGCVRQ